MTFSTTYDLLQEAKKKKPLGTSGYVFVVDIPNSGFEKYVFKGASTLPIRRTTSLTPVDYALGANFGQPMMIDAAYHEGTQGLSAGVLHKVPGHSLEEYETQLENAFKKQLSSSNTFLHADAALLESIASLPDFAFENWMHGRRQLLEHGVGGDNRYNNVIYDEADKSLRDIDVVGYGSGKWTRNNVETILRDLSWDNAHRSGPLTERRNPAVSTIREKISKAAKLAGVPRDISYFSNKTPPVFKKANLTQQLGQFSLSEVPEKLLAVLSEMEIRCPIR